MEGEKGWRRFFAQGCFKSLTLCCLFGLNNLQVQTEHLWSFVTCSCWFPYRSSLGVFLFSNVFLVMLPVLVRLTGLSLEGSKPHYLSISLTTSMNPESKPLPWGSQGSYFNATPLRQTQELQWKCMLSLKLLEGNVATWFYFPHFVKLFLRVDSSRMTRWRLVFCFSSPTKSREDETHRTAIQCCHIKFKCYITMGDRRTALSVQTQVMPSSQSGDANY